MPVVLVVIFVVFTAALMFLPTIVGWIWGLLIWMGPANAELSIGIILAAALILWGWHSIRKSAPKQSK